MAKYKHGEVIDVEWHCERGYMFVRGHMSPDDASEALRGYYGPDEYEWNDPIPVYARFSCHGSYEEGQILDDSYTEPGRGRFPIMRAEVTEQYHPKFPPGRAGFVTSPAMQEPKVVDGFEPRRII